MHTRMERADRVTVEDSVVTGGKDNPLSPGGRKRAWKVSEVAVRDGRSTLRMVLRGGAADGSDAWITQGFDGSMLLRVLDGSEQMRMEVSLMPVTIMELAQYRLGTDAESLSAGDFARCNLDILGGCEICRASIAAFNAYPTKSGYWRCADCVGDTGYATVEQANDGIFDSDGDFVIVQPGDTGTYRAMVLAMRGSGDDAEVRVQPRSSGMSPDARWVPINTILGV